MVRAVLEATEAKMLLQTLETGSVPPDRALAAPFSKRLMKARIVWIAEDKRLHFRTLSTNGLKHAVSEQTLGVGCDANCRLFSYDLDEDGEDELLIQDPDSGMLSVAYLNGSSVTEVKRFSPLEGLLIGALPNVARPGAHLLGVLLPQEQNSISFRRLESAPQLPLAEQLPLEYFSLDSRIVKVGLRGEYAVSTKLADLEQWYLLEGGDWGRLSLGPEFPAKQFDWFGNHVWADLNGDGQQDVVSKATESRELWAGLNTTFYSKSALLEMPLTTIGALPTQTQLRLAGDFDGDGDEDILLFDPQTARHQLALSLLSAPLPGEAFVTPAEHWHRSNAEGIFCAEVEPNSGQIFHKTAEYNMRWYREMRPGIWHAILRRSEGVPGAMYALGRESAPPFVCTSYQPAMERNFRLSQPNKWGQQTWQSCYYPQAIFFVDDVFPASILDVRLLPGFTCCNLPSHDILDNVNPDVRLVRHHCPDGHIAKGIEPLDANVHPPEARLRCVAIDAARFQLGPLTRGIYWGSGFTAITVEKKLRKDQLPIALRYAVERRQREIAPSGDGCVGDPPGSVFVGVSDAKGCAGYLFRELQYAGAPGDPPKGTPVQMFPECADVENIHSPFAYCKPKVEQ